jgi:dolichol-phosphate mannosyltransferase
VRRVVVTGGTGFVGASLVRRLLHDGDEVHLLVRKGHRTWRIEGIRPNVAIHEVDIQDEGSLRQLLGRIAPAWIFHLAAYGAYSTQSDLRQSLVTNVLGTASLLSASLAVGFDAFVHAGSSSEYGFKDHAPLETEWLEPNSAYAVAKASATLLCSQLGRARGENVTTLRLYSAYGPWEEPTRLIPTLAVRALDGALPALVSPAVARDYVFVDDVVEAFVLAAAHEHPDPGAVYNVATGTQLTLEEVVAAVKEELDLDADPVWGSMPDRSWDTSEWVGDSMRATDRLGWRPRISFREGFRTTVEWLRRNPDLLAWYRRSLASGPPGIHGTR